MRDLLGQAAVYGIGSGVGAVSSLVMLGLYGHFLAPADFGHLETLAAAQQILLVICAGGLGSALFGIYEEQRTDRDREEVAGTALYLVSGLALLMGAIAWSLAPLAAGRWLGVAPELVRLVALQATAGAIGLVPQALNRAVGRATHFASLTAGQALLTAALAALALVRLRLGLFGVLAAGAAGASATAAIAWVLACRQGPPRFARRWVWPLLSFGACHVPASAGAWITQLADRYLLLWICGAQVVGVYGMGYRIGSLPLLAVAGPVALAWPGYLARAMRAGDAAALCARALEVVLAVAIGTSLAVGLFGPELLAFFARHSYGGALPIVLLVLVGSAAASVQPVALSGVNLARRYGLYPVFTGVGAICNLGLNLWWIPRAGALGAALATAVAYVAQLLVTTAIAQAVRPVPFRCKEIGRIVALAIGSVGLGAAVGAQGRAAVLAVYVAGAFAILRQGRSGRAAAPQA